MRGRDGQLVEALTTTDARELIADGTIAAGMIPKIECCIAALAGGVKQAHVIDGRVRHVLLLEVLTNRGVGTEVIRGATPKTSRRRLARA